MIENIHRQLISELLNINEDFHQSRKRAHHAIDKLKVSIGPEEWNQSYRIAVFLAIKDAEMSHSLGESLFDDDMTEIGESDFE